MSTPFSVRSGPLALVGLLALAACGGDAQSAPDRDSARLEPPGTTLLEAPTEASPPVEPILVPASEAGTSAEPAAAPRPERRPATATRPSAASTGGNGAGVAATPVRTAADPPARPSTFVPAGALLLATVESELSTEKSGVGDRFHARITEDVLGANGEVRLAAGGVLNGRVATSHESTGPNDPAVLAVELESVTSDGRTLPLSAVIVELESDAEARDSDTHTAAKIGVGAAAGALVGRILGRDGSSTVKGAVAGAAAGTAGALATRDGHAVVKLGARMVVQLTERLVVEP